VHLLRAPSSLQQGLLLAWPSFSANGSEDKSLLSPSPSSLQQGLLLAQPSFPSFSGNIYVEISFSFAYLSGKKDPD
jgi:hypothetical protein